MFGFDPEVRRRLYTTNAIENLHRGVRKAVKTPGGHFPNDQAAAKLLYLPIRNTERKWKAAPIQWRRALNQLDILFGDRLQRVSYWSEWHPCCLHGISDSPSPASACSDRIGPLLIVFVGMFLSYL